MTYNGWTNYETWLTNLYFNDFTSQFEEMTEEGQFDEMDDDEILDCCTDYIEQCVDDTVSYSVNSGDNFVCDIISSFIQDVDFKEIAKHYLSDVVADVAVRNKDKEEVNE
jgi:hypothetical protein